MEKLDAGWASRFLGPEKFFPGLCRETGKKRGIARRYRGCLSETGDFSRRKRVSRPSSTRSQGLVRSQWEGPLRRARGFLAGYPENGNLLEAPVCRPVFPPDTPGQDSVPPVEDHPRGALSPQFGAGKGPFGVPVPAGSLGTGKTAASGNFWGKRDVLPEEGKNSGGKGWKTERIL